MRRLLPYEHQLIEALGISKEDYLEFVAVQQEYKDPKAGTALDIRAGNPGTVALVLTIVGVLFQVGAALLAPKPEVPDISDRRRRNREQRFAPTYGFNSAQELASYGDPLNLVYTNQNGRGDVRVAGSLVWSAIENFGSTQFMQLLLVLGASKIQEVDYTKTAFGQTGLNDVDQQSVFIFAKPDGEDGRPSFNNLFGKNLDNNLLYPERLKPKNFDKPAFQILTDSTKEPGFSQAYTPSTATSLGVFDAVPINVDVQTRDESGDRKKANIEILMPGGVKQNNHWRNRTNPFFVNNEIQLLFRKVVDTDKDAEENANDLRRQIVDALDFGSTYMLGTAKFRLASYQSTAKNVDDGDVKVNFKCIEAGQIPSTRYNLQDPIEENAELREEYEQAKAILSDPHTGDDANTDSIAVTETGLVDITFDAADTSLDYVWYPTITVEIENAEGGLQEVPYLSTRQSTYEINQAGSIAYTRSLLDELNGDKPVIKPAQIKKQIRRQIKALKDLIDAVNGGVYDGGDDVPWGNNNYSIGIDPNPTILENSNVNGVSGHDLYESTRGTKFVTHGYGKPFIGLDKTVSNSTNDFLYFSFIYIDRHGEWNFFNFNGLTNIDQFSPEPLLFPKDVKLGRRRQNLEDAQANLQKENKKLAKLKESRTLLTPSSIASDSPTDVRSILNKDTSPDLADYEASIAEIDASIEKLRKKVEGRIQSNFEVMHKLATDIIKEDIDYLEAIRDALPTDNQTDRDGTKEVRKRIKGLLTKKEAALDDITDVLSNWDEYQKAFDNSFFTKCLVKAEEASYDTLSLCNVVKFSLKTRLFRRISGRQKKYGDSKEKKYSAGDNGVKSRLAFFRLFFSTVGGTEEVVPDYVFAIRHGSEVDFYTQLGFYSETQAKWKFRFEPVFDVGAEQLQRSFKFFAFLESSDSPQSFSPNVPQYPGCTFFWYGSVVARSQSKGSYPDQTERGPAQTNEWDMFSVNSDTQTQFSFESGPEIALTAVTEQQVVGTSYHDKYSNMTMMGLGIFAGRGIQDLRSISTVVKKGKLCRTVESPNAEPQESSSYAPDIFVDTVLDTENGIGKYVDVISVDTESLQLAKRFCIDNHLPLHENQNNETNISLFMDGVIADVGSWREFWINAAPFSLLELARKNGHDTLVPALPVNKDGEAAEPSGLPIELNVSALFTAGNILEDSFKEEYLNYGTTTEDIIASVIYRKYEENELFSVKESVDVSLKNPSTTAIRETFDLSQFVTQREQAIMFGKLLCNQRRYIRKGIEFRTFPSEALIAPGEFIYVDVGMTHWDNYSAGVIMEAGALNSPLLDEKKNGTYEFLVYKVSTGETFSTSNTQVVDGVASSLAAYEGWMFVMGNQKPRKRVYRVTEVAIEEEGEVSIKALDYPCFEDGNKLRARIADFRASKFKVS